MLCQYVDQLRSDEVLIGVSQVYIHMHAVLVSKCIVRTKHSQSALIPPLRIAKSGSKYDASEDQDQLPVET